MFLLFIEIKLQKTKKEYFNVWGRRLGDATGERYPPNAARTEHVPQMLNPTPFGERFGRRNGIFLVDSFLLRFILVVADLATCI
jgi:hypothetical protein